MLDAAPRTALEDRTPTAPESGRFIAKRIILVVEQREENEEQKRNEGPSESKKYPRFALGNSL